MFVQGICSFSLYAHNRFLPAAECIDQAAAATIVITILDFIQFALLYE